MKSKFIGTWRLIHSIVIDESGEKQHPLGNNAIGYIIYDEFGTMAVQISRQQRQKMNTEKLRFASEQELRTLASDYIAYFGQYTIDEKSSLITHHLESCLFPNGVGKKLERKYKFLENNKLSLTPWNDGTNREILWEKVK